jgi:hypothetical protein
MQETVFKELIDLRRERPRKCITIASAAQIRNDQRPFYLVPDLATNSLSTVFQKATTSNQNRQVTYLKAVS